jgi:hypothetical protein
MNARTMNYCHGKQIKGTAIKRRTIKAALRRRVNKIDRRAGRVACNAGGN